MCRRREPTPLAAGGPRRVDRRAAGRRRHDARLPAIGVVAALVPLLAWSATGDDDRRRTRPRRRPRRHATTTDHDAGGADHDGADADRRRRPRRRRRRRRSTTTTTSTPRTTTTTVADHDHDRRRGDRPPRPRRPRRSTPHHRLPPTTTAAAPPPPPAAAAATAAAARAAAADGRRHRVGTRRPRPDTWAGRSMMPAGVAEIGWMRPITFPVAGPIQLRQRLRSVPRRLPPPAQGQRPDRGPPPAAAGHADGVVDRLLDHPTAGYGIVIRDADGWEYHMYHVNNDMPGSDDGDDDGTWRFAPGVELGSPVTAGQVIAWMGDSGNSEGSVPHAHVEIHTPDGTAINPYWSLVQAPARRQLRDRRGHRRHPDGRRRLDGAPRRLDATGHLRRTARLGRRGGAHVDPTGRLHPDRRGGGARRRPPLRRGLRRPVATAGDPCRPRPDPRHDPGDGVRAATTWRRQGVDGVRRLPVHRLQLGWLRRATAVPSTPRRRCRTPRRWSWRRRSSNATAATCRRSP